MREPEDGIRRNLIENVTAVPGYAIRYRAPIFGAGGFSVVMLNDCGDTLMANWIWPVQNERDGRCAEALLDNAVFLQTCFSVNGA